MFVNLFTQIPGKIDDNQRTLLSNLEQELSKRGSSLLDVLNKFEVIQLVLLIIMSFFIISLFQKLKGYLNRVHKIFELDLYIVIMIFSNLFLIMTSVLLFLIGNQGIIEDMVETISMILVLVYLLFGMGFYIKFNSLKVDFFGFKKSNILSWSFLHHSQSLQNVCPILSIKYLHGSAYPVFSRLFLLLDLLEYVFLQIQSISNRGLTGYTHTTSPSPFNTENPSRPSEFIMVLKE